MIARGSPPRMLSQSRPTYRPGKAVSSSKKAGIGSNNTNASVSVTTTTTKSRQQHLQHQRLLVSAASASSASKSDEMVTTTACVARGGSTTSTTSASASESKIHLKSLAVPPTPATLNSDRKSPSGDRSLLQPLEAADYNNCCPDCHSEDNSPECCCQICYLVDEAAEAAAGRVTSSRSACSSLLCLAWVAFIPFDQIDSP